jgi:hypothetical protein
MSKSKNSKYYTDEDEYDDYDYQPVYIPMVKTKKQRRLDEKRQKQREKEKSRMSAFDPFDGEK